MRRDLKYGVLGESPANIYWKAFLLLVALTIIAGVAGVGIAMEPQAASHGFAGFLYFVLLIVVTLALLVILPGSLGSLIAGITNHFSSYVKMRNLISSGIIQPSYCIRAALCSGVICVDEERKLVAVNGSVYKFSDVKRIKYSVNRAKNTGTITLIMKDGENPVVSIDLVDQPDAVEPAFHRILNSLGFS